MERQFRERGILCCGVDVTSKKKQNEMRNDQLVVCGEGPTRGNGSGRGFFVKLLFACLPFLIRYLWRKVQKMKEQKERKVELDKRFDETHDHFEFVFELLVIGIVFEFERLLNEVDVKTGLLLKKLQEQLKEQKEEDGRIWYAFLQKEDKTK